jgi:hypothetical protein
LRRFVVLDVADDHVAAALCSPAAFVEHRIRLADARRRFQEMRRVQRYAQSARRSQPGVKTV